MLPSKLTFLIAMTLTALAVGQDDFVNYESSQIHPIRISRDGTRLFVLDTPDNRLQVFSLADRDRPVLIDEIPVGLEPVTVTERTDDELWVVNNLSDSISVVSLSKGEVVATLCAKDEPCDVVFAGGKAFVTLTASDAIDVFDAASRTRLDRIDIFGKDPRAMAVSADGNELYALVHRSGNLTTIIPAEIAPRPTKPTREGVPEAPVLSMIVSFKDEDPLLQKYREVFQLVDNDIAVIDTETHRVDRYVEDVGTILWDVVVDPVSGNLVVANFDSRNHVLYEPVLNGHCIDSRITWVELDQADRKRHFDLNAHVDYTRFPNPEARATAVAENTGVTISSDGARVYTCGQGSDRIAVLDRNGRVVTRIDVGEARGAQQDTHNIRGPRSVVLTSDDARLFVYNKFSQTVSIVDTASNGIVHEFAIGFDPTPEAIKVGRRFNYDAKLGNGTMSCASCHVDGDIDLLCWDLGDPGGEMVAITPEEHIGIAYDGREAYHHPMKGPMLTQTLRGLNHDQPLHWRGDRANPQAFNGAFRTLMGGKEVADDDMDRFAVFMKSVAYPPNPNQELDRTYSTEPEDSNAAVGHYEFRHGAVFAHDTEYEERLHCIDCHAESNGANEKIMPPPPFFAVLTQPQKPAQFRQLYRRQGAQRYGKSKVGWGYLHDGRYHTLDILIHTREFAGLTEGRRDDIVKFLLSFDTGTAPTVGYEVQLDAMGARDAASHADIALLEAQSVVDNCDLVVKGKIDGERRGFVYDEDLDGYVPDRRGESPWTREQLADAIGSGRGTLVFRGVPPGSGRRIGIDRDRDGVFDGDEAAATGCVGATMKLSLVGGEDGVTIVARGAESGDDVLLLTSARPATSRVAVDPWVALGTDLVADERGVSFVSGDLPDLPALSGHVVYLQAVAGTDEGRRLSTSNRIDVAF